MLKKEIPIHIRKLLIQDFPGILAIENENPFPWSEAQFMESQGPFYENLVIEAKIGVVIKILGFAVMQVVAEQGDILNLAIKSEFRKKGYGSRLLQELLTIGNNRQLRKIFLEVRSSNKPAIQLYQRAGFKEIGIRKDYYRTIKGREDGILMEFVYN